MQRIRSLCCFVVSNSLKHSNRSNRIQLYVVCWGCERNRGRAAPLWLATGHTSKPPDQHLHISHTGGTEEFLAGQSVTGSFRLSGLRTHTSHCENTCNSEVAGHKLENAPSEGENHEPIPEGQKRKRGCRGPLYVSLLPKCPPRGQAEP